MPSTNPNNLGTPGGNQVNLRPIPAPTERPGGNNFYNEFTGLAEYQAQLDDFFRQDALNQNRFNTVTPGGANTWDQVTSYDANGNPFVDWTNTTSLNPELQGAQSAQDQLMRMRSEMGRDMFSRVGGELGEAPDWSQLESWGQTPGRYELDSPWLDPNLDYSGAPGLGEEGRYRSYDFSELGEFEDPDALRSRVEGEYYDKATSRLDPQMEQARINLEATMRSQGLQPGDRQWNERMARFTDASTDAYGNAQFDATRAGGAEFDRASGLDLQRRQQLASELRGETDSFNESLRDLYSERVSRRGIDTGETSDVWEGYNRTQQAQSQENRATAGMNFSQAMDQSQYANTLRQQQMTMELLQRGASLNEINALLSGQQVQLPGQATGAQREGVQPELLTSKYLNETKNNLVNARDDARLDSILENTMAAPKTAMELYELYQVIFGDKKKAKEKAEAETGVSIDIGTGNSGGTSGRGGF